MSWVIHVFGVVPVEGATYRGASATVADCDDVSSLCQQR